MHTQLTKIVATIGPASNSIERIRALANAGVSVFRMNFSHGDYQTHQNTYDNIRSVAKENNTYYSILADMQGPKLRVADFKEGKVTLKL